MIVVVNGTTGIGQEEVARALAGRMDGGRHIAGGDAWQVRDVYQQVADARRTEAIDHAISGIFATWSSLRALRRALAPLDSTSYAFRLVWSERDLPPPSLDLQRAQDEEDNSGDMGLPVPFRDPEAAADFIWDDIQEPVRLVPWSPEWRSIFEREQEALRSALGSMVSSLEHVGSTAVPGLEAKPIIDIVLTVTDLERTAEFIPPLKRLGYRFLDYPTNVDRCFFKKGRPRTHHLHLCEPGSVTIKEQIRFRDILRARADLRTRYVRLKRELELQFTEDRARYSESKGSFIRFVLART